MRLVRAATLVVLSGAGLCGASEASAHAGTKVVRYHGARVVVPVSWPVFDLATHPSVCVRFDRHAVYLGSPGAEERCPAHAVGRTEAILVAPLTAHSAGSAGAAAAPLGQRAGAPASAVQVALPARGVAVTATWAGDPALIRRALGLRSLSAPGHARVASATGPAAPALPRRPPAAHAAAAAFTGLGIDACAAPSLGAMSAWLASPYRAIGIYIGGTNMACAQRNLTPAWTNIESAAGWRLIPTYVGLQAPTSSCGCSTISPSRAFAQGAAAAADAVHQAEAVGLGAGSPIYDDMEAYGHGGRSTGAVLGFLAGWTTTLHAAGYVSGVYSSANSGISDLAAAVGTGYPEPDDIWIADWNGQPTTADPRVPAGDWPSHQRLHQYQGSHNATYGQVTLNIDSDYLDGATGGVPHVVIPDGTFVEVPGTQAVYRIAGDAPLLVSNWQAVGGEQPVTPVTQSQFDGLNLVPSDGTFLQTSTGVFYRVAGGAPLLVSDWSVYGGPQPAVEIDEWDIDNIGNPAAHLNPVPANGTFLQTPSGEIYRVAGGAPIAALGWSVFGAPRPTVVIDPWNLANLGNPAAHLTAAPANGTLVEGLPSQSYWAFSGGARVPTLTNPFAVQVDDAGLAGFPALPPPAWLVRLTSLRCVVPNLRHLTLASAGQALQRAHCRLGGVRTTPGGRRRPLRVLGQSARPRSRHPTGYRVDVLLS
jgi:hypothetical protein